MVENRFRITIPFDSPVKWGGKYHSNIEIPLEEIINVYNLLDKDKGYIYCLSIEDDDGYGDCNFVARIGAERMETDEEMNKRISEKKEQENIERLQKESAERAQYFFLKKKFG